MEIGKIEDIKLIDGGHRVRVDFDVDHSVPLYQSTTAQVRYLNLIGDRYLELKRGDGEGADRVLPSHGFIPISHTQPALDLDALIGGFKPLFRALDPEKVNNIATAIITVFQGQGGTINDILDQTAELTSRIAERDEAIGEVVKNLNIVLDTTVKHKDFDQTVDNFEKLISGLNEHAEPFAAGIANISNGAGTVGDLLADNRTLLHKTLNYLEPIQQAIVDQKDLYDDQIHRTPTGMNIVGNAVGNYGDWSTSTCCDLTLKTNGTAGLAGHVRRSRSGTNRG